jgi:hypothetical protein
MTEIVRPRRIIPQSRAAAFHIILRNKANSCAGYVLVTGGGQSRACKVLVTKGHVPITYDNLSRGNLWAVKWARFEKR